MTTNQERAVGPKTPLLSPVTEGTSSAASEAASASQTSPQVTLYDVHEEQKKFLARVDALRSKAASESQDSQLPVVHISPVPARDQDSPLASLPVAAHGGNITVAKEDCASGRSYTSWNCSTSQFRAAVTDLAGLFSVGTAISLFLLGRPVGYALGATALASGAIFKAASSCFRTKHIYEVAVDAANAVTALRDYERGIGVESNASLIAAHLSRVASDIESGNFRRRIVSEVEEVNTRLGVGEQAGRGA